MGDEYVAHDDEQQDEAELDERTLSDDVEPDQAGENPVPIDDPRDDAVPQ